MVSPVHSRSKLVTEMHGSHSSALPVKRGLSINPHVHDVDVVFSPERRDRPGGDVVNHSTTPSESYAVSAVAQLCD